MNKKLLALVVLLSFTIAQDFEYVGNSKCKTCHRKDEIGNQWKQWEESPHANSLKTLTTEESAKIAADMGIEGNAWEAPECLVCHSTGHNNGGYEVKPEEFWSPADEDKEGKKAAKRMKGLMNVGCEACHGPGSKYKSKKTMQGLYAGEIDPASVGLLEVNEETCLVCHNEDSPTHKPFIYKDRISEFEHPIPEN